MLSVLAPRLAPDGVSRKIGLGRTGTYGSCPARPCIVLVRLTLSLQYGCGAAIRERSLDMELASMGSDVSVVPAGLSDAWN